MKTIIFIAILICNLVYGQTYSKSETHDSLGAVTKSELVVALELASEYLTTYNLINDLVYRDEPTRLRMLADEIEQKEKDLAYIESIRERLVLYGVEGQK